MNIVIIGAGLAGASAATELRTQGHRGDITLIGAESHPPYERPPLSKEILTGSKEPASAFVHDDAWYAENGVQLVTGTRATGIDLDTGHVELADRRISYDRLLVATGSQPRHLPMADESGAPVCYLRTLDDALALKEALTGHVLIVGAGWIGLEVAAAVRQAGGTATVVEAAALPLIRVLGPEVAPLIADLHREHGVDLRLDASVAAIDHHGGRTTVRLGDDTVVHPDLVLVGIGAAPDDALARDAGLATDNGVLVNARLRASDPHVFAAGDVANQDHPLLGRLRVEHWDNAIEQAKHAARVMLGDDAPYERQPYFFSDQYDLGMEYVGHTGAEGYDEVVVRRGPEQGVLTALWIRADRVVAGMHANDWDATPHLRAWVGRRASAELRDTERALVDVPAPD